jgi:5-methylcytosine-specific restriction endonuclease McrA
MSARVSGRCLMSARKKLRDYFLSNLGKVLNSGELQAASGGISEWARRVRELRDEEGYPILTHNDRADLKPGQYILLTATPEPVFERSVSKETRAIVLDRNGFTCQMCGAGGGEPHPHDPSRKTRLHLGHIVDKSMGGDDSPSNLRAVCSVCNEGASNITPDRPSLIKLKAQVRKATNADQRELLDWLSEKFASVR